MTAHTINPSISPRRSKGTSSDARSRVSDDSRASTTRCSPRPMGGGSEPSRVQESKRMRLTHYKASFDGHSSFIQVEGCSGSVCDNKAYAIVDISGEVPTEKEWQQANEIARILSETIQSYEVGTLVRVQYPNDEWLQGTVIGTCAGEPDEDFLRVNVRLDDGREPIGCHPLCVIAEGEQS
jgi:hypothetical protein